MATSQLGLGTSDRVEDDILCIDRGVVIVGKKMYRKIKGGMDGEFWFKLVSSDEVKKKAMEGSPARDYQKMEEGWEGEVSRELKSEMDPVLKEWGRRFLAELEDWGRANQAGIKQLERDKERLINEPHLEHTTMGELLSEIRFRLGREDILGHKRF